MSQEKEKTKKTTIEEQVEKEKSTRKSCRELRMIPQLLTEDPEKIQKNKERKTGGITWWDGKIAPGILVFGSNLVIDTSQCYPDDMLGVIRNLVYHYLKKYPPKDFNDPNLANVHALRAIQEAIQIFDQRAIKKHGYSNSKEERDLAIPENVKTGSIFSEGIEFLKIKYDEEEIPEK